MTQLSDILAQVACYLFDVDIINVFYSSKRCLDAGMSLIGVASQVLAGLQRTADFAIRIEDSPCAILRGLAGVSIRPMYSYNHVRSTGQLFNISVCHECFPQPVFNSPTLLSRGKSAHLNPSSLPFSILIRDAFGNGSFLLSNIKYFEVSFQTSQLAHTQPIRTPYSHNIGISAAAQLAFGLTVLSSSGPHVHIVYDSGGVVRIQSDNNAEKSFSCPSFGNIDVVGCGILYSTHTNSSSNAGCYHIFFTKNGEIVWRQDLGELGDSMWVSRALRPVILASAPWEGRVNMGDRGSFLFPLHAYTSAVGSDLSAASVLPSLRALQKLKSLYTHMSTAHNPAYSSPSSPNPLASSYSMPMPLSSQDVERLLPPFLPPHLTHTYTSIFATSASSLFLSAPTARRDSSAESDEQDEEGVVSPLSPPAPYASTSPHPYPSSSNTPAPAGVPLYYYSHNNTNNQGCFTRPALSVNFAPLPPWREANAGVDSSTAREDEAELEAEVEVEGDDSMAVELSSLDSLPLRHLQHIGLVDADLCSRGTSGGYEHSWWVKKRLQRITEAQHAHHPHAHAHPQARGSTSNIHVDPSVPLGSNHTSDRDNTNSCDNSENSDGNNSEVSVPTSLFVEVASLDEFGSYTNYGGEEREASGGLGVGMGRSGKYAKSLGVSYDSDDSTRRPSPLAHHHTYANPGGNEEAEQGNHHNHHSSHSKRKYSRGKGNVPSSNSRKRKRENSWSSSSHPSSSAHNKRGVLSPPDDSDRAGRGRGGGVATGRAYHTYLPRFSSATVVAEGEDGYDGASEMGGRAGDGEGRSDGEDGRVSAAYEQSLHTRSQSTANAPRTTASEKKHRLPHRKKR
eukprot:gene33869-40978_t